MMCSRCNGNMCGGRNAITVNHNGCSCDNNAVGGVTDNTTERGCGCSRPNVLQCAACGLTRTVCRIVRGANDLFGSCGCRR